MISFKNKVTKFLTSGFEIGTFKYPLGGIWGIFLGIIFSLALNQVNLIFKILILVILIILLIPLASRGEKIFNRGKDPHCIVVDEIVGVFLTAMWFDIDKVIFLFKTIPIPLYLIIVLVYGIFDASKPFPIYRIQRLPRGWGIVLDDIIAGIYAAISMAIILRIFG